MSGKFSRSKGARGEREFFNLLNEWLGEDWVKRNLQQTREGGCDGHTHLPVAIEVKRCETLQLPKWLRQAREQALSGEVPVLAYRQNGDGWHILVDMSVAEFADYLRGLHED